MTANTAVQAAPAGVAGARRAGLGRLLQVLCLLFAVLTIVENVGDILWETGLQPDRGTMGATYSVVDARDRFLPLASVTPGGAIDKAGGVAGDRIAFDHPHEAFRRWWAGEIAGFTLIHAGRASHRQATVQAARPTTFDGLRIIDLIFNIATSMSALIGGFIIWRSRGQATTLLLGAALVAYGSDNVMPPLWFSAPAIYPFALAVNVAAFTLVSALFYAFAIRFYGDCVRPVARWGKAAFGLYGVAMLALGVWQFATIQAMDQPDTPLAVIKFASPVGFAACLGCLALGWRRSASLLQQRYALMLVATSAIGLAAVMDILTAQVPSATLAVVHSLVNSILTGAIGSGLFAYAILRHKVFDLGFAVNRTLVYAVVSAILLAAFGLIEWSVEHFIPIEGREKNALVDAAVAVGVFLTFHRVRDVVEHAVEGLFFRRWQKAEASLRRFVKEAAFITESAALAEGFVRALGQFGEGAQAAVYLPDRLGHARSAGVIDGLPDTLETNLPVLVSLRAEPKPLDVHDGEFGAAVAAPMVNRNEVIGLVLVGPKPSGLVWRPDEIELIGWAARQVGLDLHALKVEWLEAEKAELSQELSLANARLDVALGGLAQRA